jgi:fructokinase
MYRIGIDLGGTKIEGVVSTVRPRITRKRIPTEREQGYQHILNRLKSLHDDLVAGSTASRRHLASARRARFRRAPAC